MAKASALTIYDMPSEILSCIFSYKDLSSKDLLNLPSEIFIRGLPVSGAKAKFKSFGFNLSKAGIRKLSLVSKIHPERNDIVQNIYVHIRKYRNLKDYSKLLQWRKHLTGYEVKPVSCDQPDDLTMTNIHEKLGITDMKNCKVCGGRPAHAQRNELSLTSQIPKPAHKSHLQLLTNALKNLSNARVTIIERQYDGRVKAYVPNSSIRSHFEEEHFLESTYQKDLPPILTEALSKSGMQFCPLSSLNGTRYEVIGSGCFPQSVRLVSFVAPSSLINQFGLTATMLYEVFQVDGGVVDLSGFRFTSIIPRCKARWTLASGQHFDPHSMTVLPPAMWNVGR